MTKPTGTLSVRTGKVSSRALLVQALQLQALNEADKLAISERLKQARTEAGFEEREFGELLDPPITDRAIRYHESGSPQMRYLRQWAELTNVSYYWLLRGDEEPQAAEPTPTAVATPQVEALVSKLDELLQLVRDLSERQDVLQDRLDAAADDPPRRAHP